MTKERMMMATINNKPVFDVSKPNKSAPTPTSRPVIVTHQPMMKDPMVSDKSEQDADSKEEPKTETKSAPTVGEKVIAPLSQPETKTDKPVETSTPEQQTAESSEAEKKEAEAAVVEAVAEQAGKKTKNQPTKETVARQAELEKMIEEKKYFVPIGQITHRRRVRHFLIFVVVLLVMALAGGYLAVDANLVDLGIKLPYEFI